MAVKYLYEGWERHNRQLHQRIPELPPSILDFRPAPEAWPVWAIVAHLAGARVYWLCGVFKEPGLESVTFSSASGEGWEDHLDVPRGALELAGAIDASWRIVNGCLERWTPAMLSETFPRQGASGMQSHSRASVLTRLVSHDAYHAGEVSLVLGMHGLPAIDLWPPASSS
jgi:uncharacterized damage-inducible protein DinB